MGERAAAQGGTTRTRFCSFAKPSEDKTHHLGVCMGPGIMYVISAAFFFVADPLLGSRRAHRRRISGRLHMAALCP